MAGNVCVGTHALVDIPQEWKLKSEVCFFAFVIIAFLGKLPSGVPRNLEVAVLVAAFLSLYFILFFECRGLNWSLNMIVKYSTPELYPPLFFKCVTLRNNFILVEGSILPLRLPVEGLEAWLK